MNLRKGYLHSLALTATALMGSLALSANAAPTGWTLEPQQSRLDIQLTDHRQAGNTLTRMQAAPISGTINARGDIDVPLSLNQLDVVAQLPPMLTQKALKQGTKHIQGHIDPAVLSELAPNKSATTTVKLWDPAHHPDSRQITTTPVQLTRLNDGLIQMTTPSPVTVDISPLLRQDNAPLITNLLGYQQLDNHAQVTFHGTLRTQG
ncbi:MULTISPECIES: hypothetical protein [unclassified Zymobacter]|uniref:hypothetical protein n=1 Tax=unclassified Zymobacter TaxID=3048685 RepID=UPI0039C3C212